MPAALSPSAPPGDARPPGPSPGRAETLGDARAEHFAASGFSAEEYGARWARFPVGPLSFVVPNWRGRGRALSLHDLHHGLTGYDTSLRGEAETAAWELARGCGFHAIAWTLQLQAFAFGLLVCPVRTYRAFVRGRGGENLYDHAEATEELLATPLAPLRKRLGLDHERAASAGDRLVFVGLSALALICGALGALSLLFPLTWLLAGAWHLSYDPEARLPD